MKRNLIFTFCTLLTFLSLYSHTVSANDSLLSYLDKGQRPITTDQKQPTPYVPGEYIIKYTGGLKGNQLNKELRETSGIQDLQVKHLGYDLYLIQSKILAKNQSSTDSNDHSLLMSAIEKSKKVNGIVFSEPNYNVSINAIPNDTFFNDQWALNNTGQTGGTVDADIDAVEAWDIEIGDNVVTIAVIDTGVDYTHPDLDENILRDITSGNIIGYDFYNNDNDPYDDQGHGTHVAGIAASEGNNAIGVSGVCPQCSIMPIKFLNNAGEGNIADSIVAMQFAIDNGADVINNSWGAPYSSQALQDIMDVAYANGVVVVAASGNSGSNSPFIPAGLNHVISVGSTDHTDTNSFFSNYGNTLDITAPGESILSTLPPGAVLSFDCNDGSHGDGNDGYGICSGTSMASPQVAGAIGLLLSKNSLFSVDEVYERLFATADELGNPGWDEFYGFGRLNLQNLVDDSFVPEILFSKIITPRSDQEFGGTLDVSGFAFGSNFSNYTIEIGAGENPSIWETTGVSLSDSGIVEKYGDLLGNWDPSMYTTGTYTIRVSVFDTNGLSTESSVRVFYNTTLESGFPVQILQGGLSFNGAQTVNTLVEDITGDGNKEIIVSGMPSGPLYAFNSTGNLLSGWPVASLASSPGFSAAKDQTVVAGFFGFFGGNTAAYNALGETVWDNPAALFVTAPPSIGTMSDNVNAVFVSEGDGKVHGYNLEDGSLLPGWPTVGLSSNPILHTPAIADVDGDNQIELITATIDSGAGMSVIAINEDASVLWQNSYPSGWAYTFPTIGDVDGDGQFEVIIVTREGDFPLVRILDAANGAEEQSRIIESTLTAGTAPALADIDNDRIPEIFIQTDNQIFEIKYEAVGLPPLPLIDPVPNATIGQSSPVIGDVDGDQDLEIVFTTSDVNDSRSGMVHIINPDGTYISGYPRVMAIGGSAVGAIADIDQDNHNEIIITGNIWDGSSETADKVWVYDLNKGDSNVHHGNIVWGQFCHDAQNTCTYRAPKDTTTLVFEYPSHGQILSFSPESEYEFKVTPRQGADKYLFTLINRHDLTIPFDNEIIIREETLNPDGIFSITPSHPLYSQILEGHYEIAAIAHISDGDYWTNSTVIHINIADLSIVPTLTIVSPTQGEIVSGTYTIQVEEILGARKYVYGVFYNGELIFEEMSNNPALSINFDDAVFPRNENLELWVRGLVGNTWTEAAKVTIQVITPLQLSQQLIGSTDDSEKYVHSLEYLLK